MIMRRQMLTGFANFAVAPLPFAPFQLFDWGKHSDPKYVEGDQQAV